MELVIDLLDDLTSLHPFSSEPREYFVNERRCDGCGEIKPDVDIWAENHETGEQIWLCSTCGA